MTYIADMYYFFFFSSRRRHTRFDCDWSSDVCSSDLAREQQRVVGMDHVVQLGPRLGKDQCVGGAVEVLQREPGVDRKSTRLNSSHSQISYAVFCLEKKKHRAETLIHGILYAADASAQ